MRHTRKIETILTLSLLPYYEISHSTVVVVDVLRATSSICVALMAGAKEMLTVGDEAEAIRYSEKGYLVASEREGLRRSFAHLGNSPSEFTPEVVQGNTIVYCTTNGTKAIAQASEGRRTLIGSFLNITALSEFLLSKDSHDVAILCSGWKGTFNLEDTLFAGALAERLLASDSFRSNSDATEAALDLWHESQYDWDGYLQKLEHRARLERYGLIESFEHCFKMDSAPVVPECIGQRVVSAE